MGRKDTTVKGAKSADHEIEGMNYFSSCGSKNHTARAILARQQDEARVALWLQQAQDKVWAFSIPYFGSTCRRVTTHLLRNFFRDVDTDLYIRMVTGYDSYMHKCFK